MIRSTHSEVPGRPALQLEAAVGGELQVRAVGQQAAERGAAPQRNQLAHARRLVAVAVVAVAVVAVAVVAVAVVAVAGAGAAGQPRARHALVAPLVRGPHSLPLYVCTNTRLPLYI